MKEFTSSIEKKTKNKPERPRHRGAIAFLMAYISNNNPDKIHRKRHWRNEGTEEKRAGNNKDTWESHLRPSTCAVPQLYLTAPCSQDLLFMGDFFFKGRIAKLWLCTVEAKQKTPLVSKML